jgi:hypothetical protein
MQYVKTLPKFFLFLVFSLIFYNSISFIVAEPIRLCNPSSNQFPNNDFSDTFARSAWDMQYYNGKIYIASGDLWRNRGPINIWSMDVNGTFQSEFKVDDEQIILFRNYEGKLFIPGADAIESWDFGNIYIKDNMTWSKYRTLPCAVHVCDVAFFENKIYSAIESINGCEVIESSDMGKSWQYIIKKSYADKIRFKKIIPMDNYLFIMALSDTGNASAYKYSNGTIEELKIRIATTSKSTSINNLVRFGNKILYISSNSSKSQLFLIDSIQNNSIAVREFAKSYVCDTLVNNGQCYVLTASNATNGFSGCIYSSSDMKAWQKIEEFNLPATPLSFEYIDGIFYVGLGICPWQDETSNMESGSIYKIIPTTSDLIAKNPRKKQSPELLIGQTKLYQNYPSPFNPETWIPYELNEPVDVKIKIYDETGNLVRLLDLGYKNIGKYTSRDKACYWDGKNEEGEYVASGIYFYTILAGNFVATRKTVMTK